MQHEPTKPVSTAVAKAALVGHPNAKQILSVVTKPVDSDIDQSVVVSVADPYSGNLGSAMPEPEIESSRVTRDDAVKLLARIARDPQLQAILARRVRHPEESLRETSRALRLPMGVVQRRCQWLARFEQIGRLFRGHGRVADAQAKRRQRERSGPVPTVRDSADKAKSELRTFENLHPRKGLCSGENAQVRSAPRSNPRA